MSILILLGFFIAWCIITLKDQLTPPAPPIKDWDRFMKESRDKSPREVRRMIRSGEYSEEPVSKNDTKSINNPYLQHQATEDEIRPVIKYSDEDIAIAQRIEQQYNKRFEEELCAFRLQAEPNRTKDVDDVIIAALESNQCVDFNSMSGEQFEFFCSELLAKNEFTNIELTKHSGDQGIDIIAIKDGLKYGIQ